MPEYTVTITTIGEDGDTDTSTHQVTWPGSAAELAAVHGAQLGADFGNHGGDGWTVSVAGDREMATYTRADERTRQSARGQIIRGWEGTARPYEQRRDDVLAGNAVDDEIELAQIEAALDVVRRRTADVLEPLGFEVVCDEVGSSMVVDNRTADGMLAAIRRADLRRAACEHDANINLEDRDDLVRAAIALKLPTGRIAEAARLKPARLYQIRDGRR